MLNSDVSVDGWLLSRCIRVWCTYPQNRYRFTLTQRALFNTAGIEALKYATYTTTQNNYMLYIQYTEYIIDGGFECTDVQVDIAVPGKFHAFKLAKKLEARGCLRRIYTTHPKFSIDTDGIPDKKVTHILFPQLIEQAGQKFPVLNDLIPSHWNEPFTRWKGILFDRAVARKLESTEDGIFVGYAGVCLKSLTRANDLGLTTVVERSSCHIRSQKEILEKEYRKFGQGRSLISEQHIKREKKEYRIADYIMTPSKFVQKSFIERGFSEEKVIVIPIGTDIDQFTQRDNRTVESDSTTTYLFAGTIDLQKGVQYLLRAWESLDLQDSKLLLAGNISKNMEDVIAEYEDNNSVQFLGWVDNIEQLYNEASTFVFPSLHDGFGMVVTEAMASGLPVIVSENTGAKDIVRNATDGYVIPIRDSTVLADKMKYMFENPEKRKQMGNNARNRIKSNYTDEKYGDRVYSEYQKLL